MQLHHPNRSMCFFSPCRREHRTKVVYSSCLLNSGTKRGAAPCDSACHVTSGWIHHSHPQQCHDAGASSTHNPQNSRAYNHLPAYTLNMHALPPYTVMAIPLIHPWCASQPQSTTQTVCLCCCCYCYCPTAPYRALHHAFPTPPLAITIAVVLLLCLLSLYAPPPTHTHSE